MRLSFIYIYTYLLYIRYFYRIYVYSYYTYMCMYICICICICTCICICICKYICTCIWICIVITCNYHIIQLMKDIWVPTRIAVAPISWGNYPYNRQGIRSPLGSQRHDKISDPYEQVWSNLLVALCHGDLLMRGWLLDFVGWFFFHVVPCSGMTSC